jgi:hypothetical protein
LAYETTCICRLHGVTVKTLASRAVVLRVQLLVSAYSEIYFSSPSVRRRRVDFKLCLRTNVWAAAGQALVAAITGEADRLLNLELSSLADGSQLPGRAAITNSIEDSALAHRKTARTYTLTRIPCVD